MDTFENNCKQIQKEFDELSSAFSMERSNGAHFAIHNQAYPFAICSGIAQENALKRNGSP